jgi:hypothetical protein
MGIAGVTFCVLLALKISGAVDMSWWLVFSPPLIIFGIILFLSIFTGIFSGNKIRSEMADVFDKDD